MSESSARPNARPEHPLDESGTAATQPAKPGSAAVLSIDDRHTLWNVSREERAAALATRPLLLMLHGWGARESDILPLARNLPPEFVVAAPRAPLDAGNDYGFAWYPIAALRQPAAGDGQTDARPAADALVRWLDEVAPAGSRSAQISVLGFSQGGLMTTELLRTHAHLLRTTVNLSGYVAQQPRELDDLLAAERPPVFWGRADRDPVIPLPLTQFTQQWLPAHSALDERVYAGIGHGVSAQELSDVSAFLSEHVLKESQG
ncbi:alpha/beta hydrolase [Pseudoclavibacter sp. 13-3]|uniref:alpha/beta hydrolase n=1 Tax=Pseudoclavibacter sp. 13-3 TaxID=2901228 RepID=UPI001E5D6BFF|nr:esterase [Pseudoclavibacter sp. 13-3]MCD7100813.1 esterase [Pseudoclavibacter sp. 13-3]